MNRVGNGDGGESVWLAWFLTRTLLDFSVCAAARGDAARRAEWLGEATRIARAVEDSVWDGNWYLRGYFDDDFPLGASANEECRIDAIAQSWAVISGVADRRRAVRALDSSEAMLIDENARVMSLLWPPFQGTEHDPGYIRAYPAGIRENGGQYTHGVLWTVLARTKLGHADRAFDLFSLLNPIHHGSRESASDYAVEPYVVASDVCAGGAHSGRGGWTWYTGAAGWMYRIALEDILGIRREAKELVISPCVPRHFKTYEVDYRHGTTTYHITVENLGELPCTVSHTELDGIPVAASGRVPLVDDGRRHDVRVTIGEGSEAHDSAGPEQHSASSANFRGNISNAGTVQRSGDGS